MAKKKPLCKEYIVVIDNSGFDSETEVVRMEGWKIAVHPDRKFFTVIEGRVVKTFKNETFDFTIL